MNPRNAFWVLELSPDATPGEVERTGRKLVALLEVGATSAQKYACPVGTLPRDATMVREAMAALRDPKRRAREACIARLLSLRDGERGSADDLDAPFAGARAAAGFKGL
jgi:hypothetical protein